MEALTNWISNIIVLILIAVIMDLLVPNTSLQQYVKMVVGLLLILILLSPLLHIFSMDENKILQSIPFSETGSETKFENSLNDKKSEIQAAQAAYIEEQMAVHMKNQVEEELMNRYDVKITQMDLAFADNNENIQAIHVRLAAENRVETVEKIMIGREQEPVSNNKNIEQIRMFLADKWGIAEEKITIDMEGRESKERE